MHFLLQHIRWEQLNVAMTIVSFLQFCGQFNIFCSYFGTGHPKKGLHPADHSFQYKTESSIATKLLWLWTTFRNWITLGYPQWLIPLPRGKHQPICTHIICQILQLAWSTLSSSTLQTLHNILTLQHFTKFVTKRHLHSIQNLKSLVIDHKTFRHEDCTSLNQANQQEKARTSPSSERDSDPSSLLARPTDCLRSLHFTLRVFNLHSTSQGEWQGAGGKEKKKLGQKQSHYSLFLGTINVVAVSPYSTKTCTINLNMCLSASVYK